MWRVFLCKEMNVLKSVAIKHVSKAPQDASFFFSVNGSVRHDPTGESTDRKGLKPNLTWSS